MNACCFPFGDQAWPPIPQSVIAAGQRTSRRRREPFALTAAKALGRSTNAIFPFFGLTASARGGTATAGTGGRMFPLAASWAPGPGRGRSTELVVRVRAKRVFHAGRV